MKLGDKVRYHSMAHDVWDAMVTYVSSDGKLANIAIEISRGKMWEVKMVKVAQAATDAPMTCWPA